MKPQKLVYLIYSALIIVFSLVLSAVFFLQGIYPLETDSLITYWIFKAIISVIAIFSVVYLLNKELSSASLLIIGAANSILLLLPLFMRMLLTSNSSATFIWAFVIGMVGILAYTIILGSLYVFLKNDKNKVIPETDYAPLKDKANPRDDK